MSRRMYQAYCADCEFPPHECVCARCKCGDTLERVVDRWECPSCILIGAGAPRATVPAFRREWWRERCVSSLQLHACDEDRRRAWTEHNSRQVDRRLILPASVLEEACS